MEFFDKDMDFLDDDRLVASTKSISDSETENVLRPKTMDGYIGQEKIKENLKVFIDSAKIRGDVLDHVLLYGPPGLGKTTLAHLIATELGVQIKVTSGPAIEHAGDLAAILTNLNENDVLFIDEIHRLNHNVEEVLYPAMEDFFIDIVTGKGPSANTLSISVPKFTLIGATTRAGRLSSPLRDRFGVTCRLELYTAEELAEIVRRSAKMLGVGIEKEACLEIATRSRGTPRIANRFLKRVRDFSLVKGHSVITKEDADEALLRLEVDKLGLDNIDRKVLSTMIDKFSGNPCGLETLAAMTNEDAATIEDVYEPYLLQLGFIARTPRGRIVLKKGYDHMGKKMPEANVKQADMFENFGDRDE